MQSKNKLLRFYHYDKFFRKNDFYDWKRILNELPDNCSVQKSRFYKDIKELEGEYKVIWDKELRKGGIFKYEDSSFSLFEKSESGIDVNQLKELINNLTVFRGVEKFSWLDESIVRIENEIGQIEDKSKRKIIGFEKKNKSRSSENKKSGLMGFLYSTIQNKQNISISFKKLKGKSFKDYEITKYIVSPHYILESNGRWYLLGKVKRSRMIPDIFSFDGIIDFKIEKKEIEFIESKIDYSKIYDDRIGTSNTYGELTKVKLAVLFEFYHYLDSKPFHHSQKPIEVVEIDKVKYVIVQLRLKCNRELENLILHYGGRITVLEPDYLRNKIIDILKKSINLHNNLRVSKKDTIV